MLSDFNTPAFFFISQNLERMDQLVQKNPRHFNNSFLLCNVMYRLDGITWTMVKSDRFLYLFGKRDLYEKRSSRSRIIEIDKFNFLNEWMHDNNSCFIKHKFKKKIMVNINISNIEIINSDLRMIVSNTLLDFILVLFSTERKEKMIISSIIQRLTCSRRI